MSTGLTVAIQLEQIGEEGPTLVQLKLGANIFRFDSSGAINIGAGLTDSGYKAGMLDRFKVYLLKHDVPNRDTICKEFAEFLK